MKLYHSPFHIVHNTPCLPIKILHEHCFHWPGGGSGVLAKVLYGEAFPGCPTPYPYYMPFITEKVAFSHTFY